MTLEFKSDANAKCVGWTNGQAERETEKEREREREREREKEQAVGESEGVWVRGGGQGGVWGSGG